LNPIRVQPDTPLSIMKPQILLFLLVWFWINAAFSQPIVIVIGSEDARAVKEKIFQYLDELEVSKNIRLTVNFTLKLAEHVEGMTFCQNYPDADAYQLIQVRIDSRLNEMQQRLVLAHEMVHVKQFAKGELKVLSNQKVMWKGKFYFRRTYSQETPWEKEAFRADDQLVKQYYRKAAVTLIASEMNP
jgi:hypothetical protein